MAIQDLEDFFSVIMSLWMTTVRKKRLLTGLLQMKDLWKVFSVLETPWKVFSISKSSEWYLLYGRPLKGILYMENLVNVFSVRKTSQRSVLRSTSETSFLYGISLKCLLCMRNSERYSSYENPTKRIHSKIRPSMEDLWKVSSLW